MGEHGSEQERISRRLALCGIGVALPLLGVGTQCQGVAAQEKKTTYRVGIVGRTGRGDYGHGMDTAWLRIPQTSIVAVADDDREGLASAARRLKVDRTFRDYRKMLDQVKLDILAVCPRWVDAHRDMALAAARRGIHVYMEKPMCRTLAEADEIVEACRENNVKLAVAHPTRYSPKLETVKGLLAGGAIGRVLEYRGRGKEDHRGGGEDLWVLGTHMMDLIRALGGSPRWCFASVTREGKPITRQDIRPGNEGLGPLAGDAVRAMYAMPDGSSAYFSTHRNESGKPSRYGLQILGSRGIIEIQEGVMPSVKILEDPSWSPGRSGKEWKDVSSAGIDQPEVLFGPKYRERHTLAIEDLLRAIEEDRQPAGGVYAGRGAVEMILAVFESERLGRPVDLPLLNRQHPLTMI